MPSGIYKRTSEQIKKLIERNKLGQSEESRKKIGEWNKKHPNKFWLGKKRPEMKNVKGWGFEKGQIGYWKGKHISEETKRKLRNFNLGKKQSEETKRKKSEAVKGAKSYLWKGGISTINDKARHNLEMRFWRKAVLERDNFTCQKYKIKGGELVAHHINNFSEFLELRTSIENGITFSKKAHEEFHKKYGKKNNTKEQIIEFLSL